MLKKSIILISVFILFACIVSAEQKNEIKLGYSGGIDVDMWYQNTEKTTNESNIKVTLAQLILDAEVVSKGTAKIVFLFDDTLSADKLSVDEAWIRLNASQNVGLSIGKMYLPFGNRSTYLISDPLVLAIAEYNKSAFCADFKTGIDNLTFKAYAFNANAEKYNKNKDHIRDCGAALEYIEEDIHASVSFISNVAEIAAAQLSATIDTFTSKGSGIDAAVKINLGELGIFGEYTGTLSKVKYTDIADNQASIRAYNLEMNYQFTDKFGMAARLEQSERKVNGILTYKNTNVALGGTYNLFKNADIQCEYLHGVDDQIGTKKDIDKATMRFSYDF